MVAAIRGPIGDNASRVSKAVRNEIGYQGRRVQNLDELRRKVRAFAVSRDWEQFHTPKNLVMAMSVEAAEVVEHFQWLTPEESQELDGERRAAISLELADVLIYLVRLADVLDIDLLDSARHKIELNGEKYPAERVRGQAKKYTEYVTDPDDAEC